MAVRRVVPVPLEHHPELLWGLRTIDLPWVAGAVIINVVLWHQDLGGLEARLTLMAIPSGVGVALAWIRLSSRSLPEWIWLWARYQLRPKRYVHGE